MYLVMEVNFSKCEKLAKDPDDQFKQILKQAEADSKNTDENVVTILLRKMKAKTSDEQIFWFNSRR